MKKMLWLGLLLGLFLCVPHQAIAGTIYTFKDGNTTSTVHVTSAATADLHIVFPTVKGTIYTPAVCIETIPIIPCKGDSTTLFYTGSTASNKITPVNNTPVTWDYTQKNLDPTKVYYVIVYGDTNFQTTPIPHEFFTGTEQLVDKPAILTNPDGTNVVVAATVDTVKYPYYRELSATLVYSTNADLTSPVAGGALTGRQGPKATDGEGVNTNSAPGTFYWNLGNLAPSTLYYFQITVTSQLGDHISSDINSFNSSSGAFIPSGQATTQNLNTNGYTLLSGFPGLTFLPDPGLCAQEKAAAAAGKGKAPQICDINDLLNYAMKLLIGLSGVFLVFRLMYEGFVYMTSDMPFKISSSKNAIINSLLGLLLALSAYLILNTINPKLVANTINVQQLAITSDQTSIDSGTFQKITGQPLGTKSTYLPLVESISSKMNIDSCIVKATIQEESQWNAGAIGCDENSPYTNVPSRRAYVQSGINFDGTTFAATTDATATQRNNGCTFKASVPGYGLDWRFSKGGGLMQFTIAPQGYNSTAWYTGVKSGGSYWNNRNTPYPGWDSIISPETNITKGIQILKAGMAACGNNIEQTFRYYQSGSNCNASGTLINTTVSRKMADYTSCKAGS